MGALLTQFWDVIEFFCLLQAIIFSIGSSYTALAMDAKDRLYLFTGENTYMLAEELRRWQQAFLQKHGEANLHMLMGKQLNWRALLDDASTAPFLSEKRLIIIDGIPPNTAKEDMESLMHAIHPSTIVTFVESVLDKRKSVTKFLIKNATVKTFTRQTPKQLVAWLIALAKERGADLQPNIAAHVIAVVGTDQWHLKNELLKLIAYTSCHPSTLNHSTIQPATADIDVICLPSQKHTIWLMSDLIGKGKVEEAVSLVQSLHNSGEDAYSLWNIFLWIMKNLSTLWITAQEKNLPTGAMSKETGIPFPGVQSLMPCVQKFSHEKMAQIVEAVVEADRALKTGEIKATGGGPVELVTMLERRILSLGSR
jgi:DNA polymerase III subunit delta